MSFFSFFFVQPIVIGWRKVTLTAKLASSFKETPSLTASPFVAAFQATNLLVIDIIVVVNEAAS